MDEKTLQRSMLFDFYGDLLTDKQRDYFDLYHNEDLSLSEIAESAGISKQGVYDIVTRAEKTLSDIEEKTGIIKKWCDARAEAELAVTRGEKLNKAILQYFELDEKDI